MKKRSLVAALAMLMVSAIVLTSSTYAWFATGDTAKVGGLSATVSNTSGSISISTTADGTYSTSIAYEKFKGITGNYTPDQLSPNSFYVDTAAGAVRMTGGAIDQNDAGDLVFTAQDNTDTLAGYIKITVWIKSDIETTVKVTPVVTSGPAFVYTSAYAAADNYVVNAKADALAAGTRSYFPLTSAANGVDVNANSIMDTNDVDENGAVYSALGTAQSATADGSITVSVSNTPTAVSVYLWAEGNDAACYGTFDAAACTADINIEKAA